MKNCFYRGLAFLAAGCNNQVLSESTKGDSYKHMAPTEPCHFS